MFDAILAVFCVWLFFAGVRWLSNVIRGGFKKNPIEQARTRSDSYPLTEMDAEIAEKDRVLELFLTVQKALIGGASIPGSLRTDLERSKYLHFVVGAIDQLSRTIKDESKAETWCTINALGHAGGVFGVDAAKWLDTYGDPDNVTLFQSSSRGAEAMRIFILTSIDAVPEQDYKSSCLEMFKVVRGA